jgi:hypothetical protein
MPKSPENQLGFDFPTGTAASTELTGSKTSGSNECHADARAQNVASLGTYRAKRIALESAEHFAAILKLVTHVK